MDSLVLYGERIVCGRISYQVYRIRDGLVIAIYTNPFWRLMFMVFDREHLLCDFFVIFSKRQFCKVNNGYVQSKFCKLYKV